MKVQVLLEARPDHIYERGNVISTVREQFDLFIYKLHQVALNQIRRPFVSSDEISELFDRIGAPPLTGVRRTHKVTVGVKSITLEVPGNDRATVEHNLRDMTARRFHPDEISAIELDWSTVEGLPEDKEYSPGNTDKEIQATRARIETGIRDWLMEQMAKGERWCVDGVNDVLTELGIEELPEQHEYIVRREVTGIWEVQVTAFSEEGAKQRVTWNLDHDGEAEVGMVIIKTKSDDITVEMEQEEIYD